MAKEMIVPDPDRKPAGFAPATKSGNLIFVSGQTGTNANGLVEGGIREQTVQTFANVEATLKAAGATMADVMKITCFLVREKAFPANAQPASSTVIVKALVRPGLLVEVEAIAAIG